MPSKAKCEMRRRMRPTLNLPTPIAWCHVTESQTLDRDQTTLVTLIAEEETTTHFYPLSNNITALMPRWLLSLSMVFFPNAGGDPIDHDEIHYAISCLLDILWGAPPAFNLDMNSRTIIPWTSHCQRTN